MRITHTYRIVYLLLSMFVCCDLSALEHTPKIYHIGQQRNSRPVPANYVGTKQDHTIMPVADTKREISKVLLGVDPSVGFGYGLLVGMVLGVLGVKLGEVLAVLSFRISEIFYRLQNLFQ